MNMKTHPAQSEAMLAIGLMSGTSMDGVDAALVRTDGRHQLELMEHALTLPYNPEFQAMLAEVVAAKGKVSDNLLKSVAQELTQCHVTAVKMLLEQAGLGSQDIHVIGFHGHTLDHRPWEGVTWQIGDGALLAEETGIHVVGDLRANDVKLGGQGAPLVPVFHAALVRDNPSIRLPVALLNIGGVANVSYVGDNRLIAFDTGPGVAMLDDWVRRHTGKPFDDQGQIAHRGKADQAWVKKFLQDDFFKQPPPKSLDRGHFQRYMPEHLNVEDGAATLAAMAVAGVKASTKWYPRDIQRWYVCGGGRLHPVMMEGLAAVLERPVHMVEALPRSGCIDGDALEAQAFAYLAVRSIKKLPITFKETTGIKPSSATGGVFYPAGSARA